jgi:Type VI secretion system/phage-baseplate injector OB domain
MNEALIQQLLEFNRSRFFGKYRGLVTDNADPTNRGRVKVQVPAVLNELEVWALPCLPFAGNNVGVYTIPLVGAGVWVEFEGGDPSYAIWTGGFWADDELPKDEQGSGATPPLRMIRSEKGLMITFNDDAEVLTLSDEGGSNIMTFEVQSGKIKIKADIKVVVEAPLIELVESSTHPLVFGDNLLQYLNQMVQTFNAHMHPGELAAGVLPVTPMIPVPPMAPATPSLLSTKVTTG